MKRTSVNLAVDLVAFVLFSLLAATGLVERYLLPPGTGQSRTLWGLGRHDWGAIHFWIAIGLLAVLGVHILLPWKWIICMVQGRNSSHSGWRFGIGIVGLVVVIGLSAAPFLSPVSSTGRGGSRQEDNERTAADLEHRGVVEVRGSITLDEVEQLTGVDAGTIFLELSLPPDVPRDARRMSG